ncbi:hypothetical protein Tco_1339249, partial [Tanacetum coccineum]
MEIVQQSMEMDISEIKEKLAERREQMSIRAYEKDKRREEWNQKIEELEILIQSFILNPISPIKMPQPVTTKVLAKLIQNSPSYDDLGCLLPPNSVELSTEVEKKKTTEYLNVGSSTSEAETEVETYD